MVDSKGYPGKDYDLVTVFDSLHDMGDPVGAAAHVLASLQEGWNVDDRGAVCVTIELKDNLNPVGRIYYSFSTLLSSTPCSRSQDVGLCTGGAIGREADRRCDTKTAGFGSFRRVAETPFNIVY